MRNPTNVNHQAFEGASMRLLDTTNARGCGSETLIFRSRARASEAAGASGFVKEVRRGDRLAFVVIPAPLYLAAKRTSDWDSPGPAPQFRLCA